MRPNIQDLHFTECTNSKCRAIYPIELDTMPGDLHHFCPKCKIAILNSHLVQCESCQTILNFIPKEQNEEAVVFYVDKCSSCSGTIQDEMKLTANFFPDSFV